MIVPRRGRRNEPMKLVPKQWDQYNPVVLPIGVLFLVVGGYPLLMMGGSDPLVWLPRGIFGAFFAMGAVVLIRQIQLRRRRTGDPDS
jgi:hypothetical protein